MPVSTPNREDWPVLREAIVKPSIYRGDSSHINYVNPLGETIAPGEPVIVAGKVGVAKHPILPGKAGTVITDFISDFLLDPNQASAIKQGDDVYFDYDLADDDSPIGYATSTQPTNGVKLGKAVVVPAPSGEVAEDASGNPLAAEVGDSLVRVVSLDGQSTTYGETPDFGEQTTTTAATTTTTA